MGENLDRLKGRLADIHNLNAANAVLGWDEHTYMPPGGAPARGEQMATLAQLSHAMFIADETGALLQAAAEEVQDLPAESDEASLVRVTQRDYDKVRKVPAALVAEIQRHTVRSHEVWVRARQENDFEAFAPCLETTVRLSKEAAEHLGYQDRLYDALLDQFEPGMKTAQVQGIFADLKKDLIPLAQAISERIERVDDAALHQPFDKAKQEAFSKLVIERLGYDFARGRLDHSVHPFETSFSIGDVRITNRYEEDFLNVGVFGAMHEAGHAMYEQGIARSLEGTPLAGGASYGVHESQSRMWENVVGRSPLLWQYFYGELQRTFPQLGGTDLETFYRAINKVYPSYIRVEADEVTYNLHIMLRFEMELDLLEDRYTARDAPQVWNQKMEAYLGLRPPTNTLGILQDMHWAGGLMGYFPTYSLGNILSVQLYDRAVRDVPEIPEQISTGELAGLRGWLSENIYQYGRKFEPNELIERATGEPLQSRSYVAYLNKKYGEIYAL